jgi:hypothetical protein
MKKKKPATVKKAKKVIKKKTHGTVKAKKNKKKTGK